MRELVMDAALWATTDDMFLSFFKAVSAPTWHGKNFNAIRDSIGGGDINEIEVPYRLVLLNYASVKAGVKPEVDHFIEVIDKLAAEGVPVEICIDRRS